MLTTIIILANLVIMVIVIANFVSYIVVTRKN